MTMHRPPSPSTPAAPIAPTGLTLPPGAPSAALPAEPETLAVYLADLAAIGKKSATIDRRRSAIARAHKTAGFLSPTCAEAVRQGTAGVHHAYGTHQHGNEAVVTVDVPAMVGTLDGALAGRRDRAPAPRLCRGLPPAPPG
jgi:hypothetical protein